MKHGIFGRYDLSFDGKRIGSINYSLFTRYEIRTTNPRLKIFAFSAVKYPALTFGFGIESFQNRISDFIGCGGSVLI